MNRRQFLRAGLGLGAAAIIPFPYDRLIKPPAKPKKMRIQAPPQEVVFWGIDYAVGKDSTVVMTQQWDQWRWDQESMVACDPYLEAQFRKNLMPSAVVIRQFS